MVMVNKFGRMGPNMKVTGGLTKHVVKENSGTLMEIYLKVNGWMIRPTDTVYTFIKMEPDMRASGRMIFSTVLEKKFGQIIVNTKDIIQKVKNTEKGFIFGRMDQCTMETGTKTESKVTENTNGKMEECISENGKTIICMVRVSTLGLMEGVMKVSTRWIKSMGLVFISGPMVEFMKEIGSMENSTAQENIYYKIKPSK